MKARLGVWLRANRINRMNPCRAQGTDSVALTITVDVAFANITLSAAEEVAIVAVISSRSASCPNIGDTHPWAGAHWVWSLCSARPQRDSYGMTDQYVLSPRRGLCHATQGDW